MKPAPRGTRGNKSQKEVSMLRDKEGRWRDRHGRVMVRWCIIEGQKHRKLVCYCAAATAPAALSIGIPLDKKTATAVLESSLLEAVVLENENKNRAAWAVLNTRDFCGDERQALKDFCSENSVELTEDFLRSVFSIVEATWQQSQNKAGVNRC